MGTSVYTSLLIKDYRRKAGEIQVLRKDLRELAKAVLAKEADLRALNAVISNRVSNFDAASVKPVATYPKVAGLKWNQLTILILDCLREAGSPVGSDVITMYILEKSGRDIQSRIEQITMQQCVKNRLKNMAGKGRVVRHHSKKTTSYAVWSLPTDE